MIYLKQTLTTVGFLSKDKHRLNSTKHRSKDQPLLQEVCGFADLSARIPKIHKKMVRNMSRTTIIAPNNYSFRVVSKETTHEKFIQKFGAIYSTSANKHGEKFDMDWAKTKADVVVYDRQDFVELEPSSIIKLGKTKLKRIR